MFRINLPVELFDAPFQSVVGYCNHFNCTVQPLKTGQIYYVVESEDPINFFWLGINFNLKGSSSLTTTTSEKHFGK